jgi:sporulation protein YlmC with PRC-barrel domain
VRLSELLGAQVRTEAGRSLGHVYDVRARFGGDGELVVTGLVVGRLGLLERLGIGAWDRQERLRSRDVVAWEHVESAEPGLVVVRDSGP